MTGPVRLAEKAQLAAIEGRMEADLSGAEVSLRELVAAYPEDPYPLMLLAKLCFRRSGFAEMRELAEAALTLAPEAPQALGALAFSHYYLGELEASAAAFERLAAVSQRRQELERHGSCLFALGRLEAAARCFHRVLEIAGAEPPHKRAAAQFQLARILRDQGHGGEADTRMTTLLAQAELAPLAISSTLLGLINRMDFHEWDRFRKKEALFEAIQAYGRAHGAAAFPYHPRTYVMPRDHQALLAAAAAGEGGPLWIVKPTHLFGGQGMRLIDDPAQVAAAPGVIVQDYIAAPYLLQDRKAHLRLYLLITSAAPLRAYFWRDGIVRFAPEAYRPPTIPVAPDWLERQGMHITNTALHLDHPELRLSEDASVEDEGNIWSLAAYVRHIGEAGGDVERLWRNLDRLALGFLRVVEHSGLFARQAAAPSPRAYPPKFIGLDVLLDADLRPWLLEAQRMPGQTGSPLVDAVNGRLFRTIFSMIVAPLGDLPPEAWSDREAELERLRRGDFVPLHPEP